MPRQNKEDNVDFTHILNWINGKNSILIVTHKRPDGDALGSLAAMDLCLKSLNKKTCAFVSKSVPQRYKLLIPQGLTIGEEINLGQFDAMICLDTATEERIDLPNKKELHEIQLPVLNIDHHVDNSRYGEQCSIGSDYAATAEILADFIMTMSLPISPNSATMLMMGMITDTGGFRFSNTSPRTLKTAAWLLEQSADYNHLIKTLYYNDSIQFLKLRARLYETMRFAYDNRLAYFFVTPALLKEFNVDNKDTEDLIECARVIEGAEIVCRIQLVEDGVRFSLRSQNQHLIVNEIAHKLGGGGHEMAAGAHVKNINLKDGERLLLDHAETIFSNTQ